MSKSLYPRCWTYLREQLRTYLCEQSANAVWHPLTTYLRIYNYQLVFVGGLLDISGWSTEASRCQVGGVWERGCYEWKKGNMGWMGMMTWDDRNMNMIKGKKKITKSHTPSEKHSFILKFFLNVKSFPTEHNPLLLSLPQRLLTHLLSLIPKQGGHVAGSSRYVGSE